MKKQSMIDTAYAVLEASEEALTFKDLWDKIKAELEIGPDEEASRIGHFYTDISLDGRFVEGKDNTWKLRSRTKYEEVHIDMSDVYSSMSSETDQDAADVAEDLEYDASVQGRILDNETEPEDEDESAPKTQTAEDLGIKGIA